ncbi:NAD dependent epimerase/dehydratase family protein [Thozetella sp. PMI_491]|nr:NAD dependent epimerase/dehydratase family protein [Thozetella sp. PMI_491]
MPRILILGASGYLGLAIGQALIRSGNHSVCGVVRASKPEKAKTLTENEITPILGDATDPEFLTKTIAAKRIDVVIDVTQAYEQAGAMLQAVVQAARARADALAKDDSIGPKLGFIYTSGSWVHGSPSDRISDLTVPGTSLALDKPATAVSWRPAHEQAVLQARDVLDVAIIRPSLIYGRGTWSISLWWGPLLGAAKSDSTEPVQLPVGKDARAGVVSVDDLASAYVLAIDRINGQLGSWPVFDAVTETVPVSDVVEATAKVMGVIAPLAYAGTQGNAYFEAMGLVSNSDGARARTVLGWEPKRRDFVQNIPVLVAAWESVQ